MKTESKDLSKLNIFFSIYLIVLFFANLVPFLFENRFMNLHTSYFMYFLYFGVLINLLFIQKSFRKFYRNTLFYWSLFYVFICLLWMLGSTFSAGVQQILITNVQSVVFLICSSIVFSSSEKVLLVARITLAICTLMSVALNIYEFFNPLTFSAVYGRSAGLYVNPNGAGISLILGMLIGLEVIPKNWRCLYCFTTLLGVLLTFSRSTILLCIIIILILMIKRKISLLSKSMIFFIILFVLFMTVYQQIFVNIISSTNIMSDQNVINRIQFALDDNSAESRYSIAKVAFSMFSESPFIGHGLGASSLWDYSISSHNIYLNLLVDFGIIGIAVIGLLFLAIKFRGYLYTIYLLALIYWGFFNHNILQSYSILVSVGLMYGIKCQQNVIKTKKVDKKEFLSRNNHIYSRALLDGNGSTMISQGVPQEDRLQSALSQ